MYILSIWWGYASGASLYRKSDNCRTEIIGASSEERFTGIKNTSNFPSRTIAWLKSLIKPSEKIEKIVYTSNDVGVDYLLCDKGRWPVEKYIEENVKYWKPRLYESHSEDYFEYLREDLNDKVWPGKDFWVRLGVFDEKPNSSAINNKFNHELPRLYSDEFNISKENIYRIDHHRSHRHYAISSYPNLPDKLLVFTVDGWGDGRNSTVAIVKKRNAELKVEEIFSSSNCTLARTYRFITLLLGMKPSEHEFKVMGLASYGKEEFSMKAYQVFGNSMYFCKRTGDFKVNTGLKDSFFSFREMLIGERFDNISTGLQLWLEKSLEDWVCYFIKKTGIDDIAFSGGVAMNVRAMGKLQELPIVRSNFVPPTAGDESHIFGSYYTYDYDANDVASEQSSIPYYGYNEGKDLDDQSFRKLIKNYCLSNIDYNSICKILINGGVVGLCRGKAEFGARALGNRSLLIDASNIDAKEILNSTIKNRDFWMPFAPIVLDQFVKIYFDIPLGSKQILNRFMTTVFRTSALGKKHLSAAVHSSDFTCRAQILKHNDNPFLYDLILHYYRITGKGCLLNTSFNVHGSPIVNNLEQAFSIFCSTNMNMLVTNNYLLAK